LTPPGLPAPGSVERICRLALEDPALTLLDERVEPVAYDAYLPGRTVTRVVAHARSRGRDVEWSAIRKWTDAPSRTPTAPSERAHREALAYRSGWLDRVGDLRMPEAFDVELDADGEVTLWLEDVRDREPGPWPLESFGVAARALGHFNGVSSRRAIPTDDWLVGDWAARQSEPVDLPVVLAELGRQAARPVAREALGAHVAVRVQRLQLDQPLFVETLALLPQSLCHHDAARSNLVRQTGVGGGAVIVALDWESVGPGAVGAEIATLVSGSVRKGDFPADRLDALDGTVFSGYLGGLRDAGWTGDERLVRLGYAMSVALRCWFVRDTLRHLTEPTIPPRLGRALDVASGEALDAFISLSRFVLDRADEAHQLLDAVGRR
jgi:hypothetical protein